MSLFASAPPTAEQLAEMLERADPKTLGDILAYARTGSSTWAGPTVTPDTAMRLSAVFSSVNLMADLVSTMPVDVFRGQGKSKTEVSAPKVVEEPSQLVDVEAWKRQAMVSALMRGNAYGLETATGDDGWPRTVEIVHPDDVTWKQPYGKLSPVEWSHQGRRVDAGAMRHLIAHAVPGSPVGLSPIGYMRQTFGLGLAVQEFGARWFGDGAHPTGTLETDQAVDQGSAGILKRRIMRALRWGRREPLVLGKGVKWNQVQVNPDDSQFLETIGANRKEVVSIFFPHLVLSEGDSMTYANIEARTIDLLVFDVQPWLVRLERWWSRMLPRGQYVKFNTGALVRSTLLERYKAHQVAVLTGWRNANEIRDIEDESPIGDEGDQYLWPPAAPATMPPTMEGNNS